MPENPAALHVVGRTADGKVWHTIRGSTGWTPFGNVLTQAGRSTWRAWARSSTSRRRRLEPALNGQPEGLYVVLALNDARAVLLFRNIGVNWPPTTSSSTTNSRSSAPTRALALATPRAGVGSSTRRPQH